MGVASPSPFSWLLQPYSVLLAVVVVVVICWITLKALRLRRRSFYTLKIRDPLSSHHWHPSQYLDKPTYCNSCLQLCIAGSSCEACGLCICSDNSCLKMASTTKSCKPLSMSSNVGKTPHFWVKGNLPLCSLCFKCLGPCGNLPKLADYRCVWCQQTAHEDCVIDMDDAGSETCSLGPFQGLIIPPNCVSLKLEGWRGRRKLVVKSISRPLIDSWHPLVVMANPRSGGKDGEFILSSFRKLFNPIQVIDLSETPPEHGLEICRMLEDLHCRVLVCGGDGTVGWVLSTLDKLQLPSPPHVGILPLGTGNDLARVLGWGKGYDNEDINDIIMDIDHAQLSLLDRWQVKIEHRRYLGLKRGAKVITMNNYLGIGCDAGVALNFHRQRETRPELFKSRIINKAWYVGYGARDVLEQSCKNLPKKIDLYLDGVLQEIPALEGVVLLNINSWSAGCSVWEDTSSTDSFGPSRIDDQLIEVVGLYSSLHVGKIQVSLDKPVRLGQASAVTVVIKEHVPVQVDGEPWLQGPATISVTHQGQAHMLRKVKHD